MNLGYLGTPRNLNPKCSEQASACWTVSHLHPALAAGYTKLFIHSCAGLVTMSLHYLISPRQLEQM